MINEHPSGIIYKIMSTKKEVDIFIVDDNRIFALALKGAIEAAFENRFVKIHLFGTGEACLEKVNEIAPELVVLDYNLNSHSTEAANGHEVLDRIKKMNAKTSVIMLTSNDTIDIALKSFHHGASDYVVKTESQFGKINLSISKILAEKDLAIQNEQKARLAVEQIIAGKEREFMNKEEEKRAGELLLAKEERAFQTEEKEKRAVEYATIHKQKSEIERSKQAVEEKNKDMTDSINYAKRIQLAKLPRKEDISAVLKKAFVLFKPKDIVSGDFYYFRHATSSGSEEEQKITRGPVFLAAADCTGHGVPGAFLSMIGMEKLNEAVSHSQEPSEILQRLNKGIKISLHQSENLDSTKDGMDIAFCAIDMDKRVVKYAGANRPIWIIRKGEGIVEEIKATKKAIGGYTEDDQNFDMHEILLKEGDTFYIFSDGYSDSFGGKNGKKLMTRRFKEVLLNIQEKNMSEQETYLEHFIESWKSGAEQVDDILVIGVRL